MVARTRSQEKECLLLRLPDEQLQTIVQSLSIKNLLRAARTCCSLKRAAYNCSAWAVLDLKRLNGPPGDIPWDASHIFTQLLHSGRLSRTTFLELSNMTIGDPQILHNALIAASQLSDLCFAFEWPEPAMDFPALCRSLVSFTPNKTLVRFGLHLWDVPPAIICETRIVHGMLHEVMPNLRSLDLSICLDSTALYYAPLLRSIAELRSLESLYLGLFLVDAGAEEVKLSTETLLLQCTHLKTLTIELANWNGVTVSQQLSDVDWTKATPTLEELTLGNLWTVPWQTLEVLCSRPALHTLQLKIEHFNRMGLSADETPIPGFEQQLAELQKRWPKVKMSVSMADDV